jgi:hypothetical protein
VILYQVMYGKCIGGEENSSQCAYQVITIKANQIIDTFYSKNCYESNHNKINSCIVVTFLVSVILSVEIPKSIVIVILSVYFL